MKKTDNQSVVKDGSFCAYGGQLQTAMPFLVRSCKLRTTGFIYLLLSLVLWSCTDIKKDKNMCTIKIKYDSSKYKYLYPILIEKEKYNLLKKFQNLYEAKYSVDNNHVNKLHLDNFTGNELTESIYKFNSIYEIRIKGKYLKKFPKLSNFYHLKDIEIENTSGTLRDIGEIIIPENCHIERLWIFGFTIENIVFPKNSKIKELYILGCNLNKFPETLCNLRYLEIVRISSENKLKNTSFDPNCLPENIRTSFISAFSPEIQKKVSIELSKKIKLRMERSGKQLESWQ